LSSKQHHQAVDADAEPACGRHAVLHGHDKIFLIPLRLRVAELDAPLLLRIEARRLLLRIVELGECVGDLYAGDEGLEALDQPVIPLLTLGQRRGFRRVII